MAKLTKITLALAALTFPTGFLFFFGVINVDAIPELHVLFPLGVIFLGMFLIFRALEKHLAAYDAEHRADGIAKMPDPGPRENLSIPKARRRKRATDSPLRERLSGATR